VGILHKDDELDKLMIMHGNRSAEGQVPDGRVQEIRMLTQLGWVQRSQMRVVKVRQLGALESDILHGRSWNGGEGWCGVG
jgi:hypothetical protein